jgi:hypothetical protein
MILLFIIIIIITFIIDTQEKYSARWLENQEY